MTPNEMERAIKPETASPAVRRAMWEFHRNMWRRRHYEGDHKSADYHDREARRWNGTPPNTDALDDLTVLPDGT